MDYQSKDVVIKSPIALYYLTLGSDYFMGNIVGSRSLDMYYTDIMSMETLSDYEKQEIWDVSVYMINYSDIMFGTFNNFRLVREWDTKLTMFNCYILHCRVKELLRKDENNFNWVEFKTFYVNYTKLLGREEYVLFSEYQDLVEVNHLKKYAKTVIIGGSEMEVCSVSNVIEDLEMRYPEILTDTLHSGINEKGVKRTLQFLSCGLMDYKRYFK